MRPSVLRMAAVRTLAVWIVLFVAFAGVRALTRMQIDDFVVVRLAGIAAVSLALAWLATMLLRRPRIFQHGMIAGIAALLIVPVVWGKWDGMRDPLPSRIREREALEYLQHAHSLEMPLVGFGAEYSGGFLAMRILHRSPSADAAFKELIRSGTLAGQLYGLIGVRRTDPAHFSRVARSYGASNQSITVMAGCVMRSEEVGPLVRTNAATRLRHGESLGDWAERHPHLQAWPPADIAGGAYSSVFFDRGPYPESALREAESAYDFTIR